MEKLKTGFGEYIPLQSLALLKSHRAAMTGNSFYPTPEPDAASLDATIADLEAKIATKDAAQMAHNTAIADLSLANTAAQAALSQRATSCNAKTPGNEVALLTAALPLVSDRTPAGDTPRVLNLELTPGDHAGTVNASWANLRRQAKSYQAQTTTAMPADPSEAAWVNQVPVTKSRTTIGPFTSGSRVWVRVRAIGTNGPGDWSDPGNVIVP